MQRIFTIALAATTLVGLGACSSDSKSSFGKFTSASGVSISSDVSTQSDVSISSDLSVPPDLSVPFGGSVPAILGGDCQAIYAQMITAMAQAFAPEGEKIDVAKVFGAVSANVPQELQADVKVMSAAMTKLADVMKQYNSDMTNPAVMKALQALSTPEVQAASERLTAYFDTTCKG